MPNYLQSEDDGLPMRESKPHVVEKLHYLKRYIDIFETSMYKKPWHKRHYIDLFAGPGKCSVERTHCFYLGSPLLALTTKHPFTDYFFVDMDPANVEALKQRCSISPLSGHITFINDDSNTVVGRIVDDIKEADRKRRVGTWSSLNLAFLDPEGLELQWTTVAALAMIPKMDLIIHYPEMGLTRNFDQFVKTNKDTPIDLFFGDFEWRDIYAKHLVGGTAAVHRKLIDHYEEKLAGFGYVEVKEIYESGNMPQIRNTKGAPLYRLLFASKNPLGNDFWKKVMSVNAYGQRRSF